jgi:RNA polymerase sigma-70 factor (ECF subfamily)
MVDGHNARYELIEEIAQEGALENYHLLHAAKADMSATCRSLIAASKAYARALELVTNDAERRFLHRRLQEVQTRPHMTKLPVSGTIRTFSIVKTI